MRAGVRRHETSSHFNPDITLKAISDNEIMLRHMNHGCVGIHGVRVTKSDAGIPSGSLSSNKNHEVPLINTGSLAHFVNPRTPHQWLLLMSWRKDLNNYHMIKLQMTWSVMSGLPRQLSSPVKCMYEKKKSSNHPLYCGNYISESHIRSYINWCPRDWCLHTLCMALVNLNITICVYFHCLKKLSVPMASMEPLLPTLINLNLIMDKYSHAL